MKTHYAPAERLNKSEIILQNEELISIRFINEIAAATNNLFLILNKERQIVFANQTFLSILGITKDMILDGKRIGESFNCKNSFIEEGGCGTSEYCIKCGAVNAILEALDGNESEKECRITTIDHDALDFLVKTKPFNLKNNNYVFVSATDISDTKRREILERTFFHDILNTAGGLYSLAELLRMEHRGENNFYDTFYDLSDRLIKEIKSQQLLLKAENGSLQTDIEYINVMLFMKMIKKIVLHNKNIEHVNINIIESDNSLMCKTDPALLQRVLVNMVKNAAEASAPGEIVTLSANETDDNITLSVNNPRFIPEDIQLQIFQRSFSTKGIGRGIGTYSMKLLGEKYLGGKVDFTTDKENGTTFFITIPKQFDMQE